MSRAGEAVNDQRIPRVPSRIRIARSSTHEKQEHGDRPKIRAGKEKLVEQRPIGNSAQARKKNLRAGWIDRAKIAMIDFLPLRKFGADWLELGIIRRMNIRIEAGPL